MQLPFYLTIFFEAVFQVGKKLSELIRDLGGQAGGIEQGRWQSELTQVAVELIAVSNNKMSCYLYLI